MKSDARRSLIRGILTVAILAYCCFALSACHVFAWYVPKPYDDEQKAEIYAYLKDELLINLSHVIVSVTYEQEEYIYAYSVFSSENKIIISYDVYGAQSNAVKRGLFYEGTLYEWDVETRSETVKEKDIGEYVFLFEQARVTADYFKTQVLDVMPYRDDSYFWECYPWGMGMAQMYYMPEDGSVSVSASWTVEKSSEVKNGLPLVHDAEFHYGSQTYDVSIVAYGSPYGIDERITNIIDNYKEMKLQDEKMLYRQIYIKGFGETLFVELYNNDAAKELINKLADGDITVTVDDYGGFEKVGSLGFDLPTSDEQITAGCCDVMLYCGNQIVIFYGENTWDYTPLGIITGYSDNAFANVIGQNNGKIQITLTLNEP